jgi:type I restriction enzyme S subunit
LQEAQLIKIDHIKYKQTQVILIPDDWKVVRLGEVCEKFVNGGTPDTGIPTYWDGNIPWITGADITSFGVSGGRKFITEEGLKNSATQLVPQNTVLVVTRTGVGKVGIAANDLCFSQDITGIICGKRISPEYLARFILFQGDNLASVQRGATIKGVTRADIDNLKIPLPPLPEQKRIAAKIQDLMQEVDRARTACEKQLEAAKALPAAYLRQVFESEEAKKWERKRLGEVAIYINGRAFKPEEWRQTGIPIIRIQNLNDPNASFNYYDGEIEGRYKVRNGDLLISWSASLGAYLWTGGDAVLNQHIFKVEEHPGLMLKNFLYYAVDYVMTEIKERIHGATMQHITKPEFEAIFIPIPCLFIQQNVAAELKEKMAEVEKLRTAIEKQLEAINALPQAILIKAFKGEL